MSQKSDIKKRNPVARNPLLRKGGAHKPPANAVRPGSKSLREDALAEWDETRADTNADED